jgi:hypothetical protein
MVTDAELRAMSTEQRRALARRLAALAEAEAAPRLYRRRRTVVAFTAFACATLIAWTLRLGTALPARYLVGHWDLAWIGFDILLAGSIAATGILTWRGSPARAAASLTTAVLLVCDAWFDITTAANANDLWNSVLTAGLVELPLAVAAGVLAWRQAASAAVSGGIVRAARLPATTATPIVSSAPSRSAAGSPGRNRPELPPMVAAATGTPS